MKIVMVDPSLFTGCYDDALGTALGRRGHDVTLAARPMRATDALAPVGYAYVPRFFRVSEMVCGSPRLRQVVKAADYMLGGLIGSRAVFARADVVHWQWLPLAVADRHWLRLLRGRHPLVHTVHNANPFHGASGKEVMQGNGYFDLLGQFDALIVHGEETRA